MSMIILDIPNVAGESSVEIAGGVVFKDKILCESLSQDMTVEMEVSTNARRTVHTPKVENITLERKWDRASPKLISLLLRSANSDTAKKQWTIHCLKPIGDTHQWGEFLTIELSNPLIAKHSLSVSEGDTTETIEINATEIYWTYKRYTEDQKHEGGGGVKFNLLKGTVSDS
ncbi:T6SS component Hcp [Azospirillum argentinense]|uniref:type VI secretion system tube protein Hcp n=1 Tax=Azospirillum argentinense TaxID=2970906 RepID=UPI0032DEB524